MKRSPLLATLLTGVTLSACAVGPDYRRPAVAPSPAFKEAPSTANGWVPAQPMDTIDKGAWWSVFGDPVLDALEERVAVSNQTLKAAEAAYRQARALTAADQASLFPTVTLNGSNTSSHSGGGSATTVSSGVVTTAGRASNTSRYQASLGATWAVDVWGRIRRQVESDRAGAQASAADVANARLSAQTQLATDYFLLRTLDEQKALYDDTVAAYGKAATLTENQYNAGVVAKADVITARTQLLTARAQAADVGVQRAQAEHAIAVLTGHAPSDLTLAVGERPKIVPTPPVGLPSELLQRRPDIAAAERQVAEANALVGVQTAAWFPSLTLSGSYGYSGTSLGNLFTAANNVWSVGPTLAATLLDFGARQARVSQARAAYDQRVALYRQTVLTAFQQVEDQLVALRVLEQESALRDEALASARQAEALALNRYRAGQVDYTTVVQAQATALSAAQTVLTLTRQRQAASVALIEALGGGWTTADLPRR